MCASEHCAQAEQSSQVVKADNMQLPRFESTEEQTEKWALIFYFRLRWIYTRMTKVRRRCNGLYSGSSQTLGTVNTKLENPEL